MGILKLRQIWNSRENGTQLVQGVRYKVQEGARYKVQEGVLYKVQSPFSRQIFPEGALYKVQWINFSAIFLNVLKWF